MFSISPFKDVVLHPHPLQNPPFLPAVHCQEQNDLTLAQESDQLTRLQAECDSYYVDSKFSGHKVTIHATSSVKIFIVRSLWRHGQNHVRTWFNQPAREARSPKVHQKMPIMLLPRTSDGSFKLIAERSFGASSCPPCTHQNNLLLVPEGLDRD